MSNVMAGRHAAQIEGDFVVFIIGTRVDLRHPVRWFLDTGGKRGMPHMLKHLSERPDSGLLGYLNTGVVNIQYWRSYEHLEAFARNTDDPHLAAWRRYWKRVGKDARSGIWHETYLVRAGEYEAIYANMPPIGLGKAAGLVGLSGSSSARSRLGRAVAGASTETDATGA